MVFKNFRVSIILRVALIALAISAFFFFIRDPRYTLTAVLAGVLTLVQCALLVRAVERAARMWSRFFEAVNSADFSRTYALPGGRAFSGLKEQYDAAMRILRRYHRERESHRQYIQTVLGHIDAGILIFRQDGEIDLVNDSFRLLLGTPPMRNVAEMEGAHPGLYRRLWEMKNGGAELVRLGREGERLQLIMSVRDFILLNEKFRLVSLQDIGRELEETEMDAWQKLARVLTHEIMNSITPIASLASTANSILRQHPVEDGGRDVSAALRTIEKRSQGLLAFVEKYRSFLKVPRPAPRAVKCGELMQRVAALMDQTLKEKRIALTFGVRPDGMELTADPDLLEQALINLIKNSAEALAGARRPAIEMSAYYDRHNRPVIEVADNGEGISEGNLDKIFVPFFTTKGDGSGIGLSLCRQIMRLHRGSITVSSAPGERTVFSLRF